MIALTGNETDSRLNLYTKGVIDCLCKPVIDHEVIFRVKTILHYFCCVYIQTLNHKKYLILENNSDNPINSPIEINIAIQQTLNSRDINLVDKTCQYLHAHIDKKVTLEEIALLMGTCRSTLAKKFKLCFGKGVFEWLREQRMLKAQSLLLNSEMTIQQIGFEVGYENCANFSTAYKRQFKVSPRQQRKLCT